MSPSTRMLFFSYSRRASRVWRLGTTPTWWSHQCWSITWKGTVSCRALEDFSTRKSEFWGHLSRPWKSLTHLLGLRHSSSKGFTSQGYFVSYCPSTSREDYSRGPEEQVVEGHAGFVVCEFLRPKMSTIFKMSAFQMVRLALLKWKNPERHRPKVYLVRSPNESLRAFTSHIIFRGFTHSTSKHLNCFLVSLIASEVVIVTNNFYVWQHRMRSLFTL